MREHEQTRSSTAADSRRNPPLSTMPPAPQHAGILPAPAQLLALQRAAGNAAVQSAIQQARHVHGTSCGHDTPTRRSTVTDVLRSTGRSPDGAVHEEMVAQRMEVSPQDRTAFLATHNPRNRVILNATLNGVDLGLYGSAAHSHDRSSSDHAEDAILDALETLAWQNPAALLPSNTLVITNLTASPCTTTVRTHHRTGAQLPITSNKGPAGSTDGCTERLIELANGSAIDGHTFRISITCDHYYQPQISGAKDASRAAVAAMQAAGITVTVTNQ
jgi:hypothetical protein